jgi:hypothetical protein
MDPYSAEFGLINVVRSPGYASKKAVSDLVMEADDRGMVRRMSSGTSSMYLRPQAHVHFEMIFGGVLCVVRGLVSKEVLVSDHDNGYVTNNCVWLLIGSRTARFVSIEINPFIGSDRIWIRPSFSWHHEHEVSLHVAKDRILREPTASVMDAVANTMASVTSEERLESVSKWRSRLRAVFIRALIEGAESMPDVKLPLGKPGCWTRASVMKCWSQAMNIMNPIHHSSVEA